MRKKVDTWEIARLWVKQSQEEARCSSHMSFEGTRFFSYSTIIAEIVDSPKGKVYFVSEERYSRTTARHLSDVRSAIHGTMLEVPGVSMGTTSGLGDIDRILDVWGKEIFDKIEGARIAQRTVKKIRLLREAEEVFEKMRKLDDLFKSKAIPKAIKTAYDYARWKRAAERL